MMCCGLGQTHATDVVPGFWDCLVLKLEDWFGAPLPPTATPEMVAERVRQQEKMKRTLQVSFVALIALLLITRVINSK